MSYFKVLNLFLLLNLLVVSSFANEATEKEKTFLVVFSSMSDEKFASEYKSKAGPIMKKHGGKMPPTSLEYVKSIVGRFNYKNMLLMEFPNRNAIVSAFLDPDYKTLIDTREKSFDSLGIFIFKERSKK